MMSDDTELLRRFARDRSPDAFTELAKRHLGLVYSSALRRLGGDVHHAQDVAQKVFVALARELAPLGTPASLTGWLYTTTRNFALNAARAEQRRQAREQAAATDGALPVERKSEPEWDTLRPQLDEIMDELDEPDRIAVLWRYFEGRTFAQIGALLAVEEDAARTRVNRALDKLRDGLARRGITATSAALGTTLTNRAGATAPPSLAAIVSQAALNAPRGMGAGWPATAKIVAAVATVALLVMTALVLFQAAKVRTLEATVHALLAENDELKSRASTAEDKAAAAEGKLDNLGKKLEALLAEKPVAPAPLAEEPPKGDTLSIQGQIRYPGTFLTSAVGNVGELIAKAGGLTELADGRNVTVTRINNAGRKQTWVIDLDSAVETSDGNRTAVFPLQARDIVEVPAKEAEGNH